MVKTATWPQSPAAGGRVGWANVASARKRVAPKSAMTSPERSGIRSAYIAMTST